MPITFGGGLTIVGEAGELARVVGDNAVAGDEAATAAGVAVACEFTWAFTINTVANNSPVSKMSVKTNEFGGLFVMMFFTFRALQRYCA